MTGFNDAVCSNCHERFGWQGELKDRPPCPKCGHKVSLDYLQSVEEKLKIIRDRTLKGEKHGKVEPGDSGDLDHPT